MKWSMPKKNINKDQKYSNNEIFFSTKNDEYFRDFWKKIKLEGIQLKFSEQSEYSTSFLNELADMCS